MMTCLHRIAGALGSATLALCLMGAATAQMLPSHLPHGLNSVPFPEENHFSQAKAELGKLLFFDGRLSPKGISCTTCHDPARGFAGNVALNTGASGKLEPRHTPTAINRTWAPAQMWDGHLPTLEVQINNAVTNPDEMGSSPQEVERALLAIPGYAPLFEHSYGDAAIRYERVAMAIATYERTLVSANSAYDRYLAGDKSALTKSQKAGLEFFNHKGECAECHSGPNLTDERYSNTGVGFDRQPDAGRKAVTGRKSDNGRFKTPTLRDVARRGPYMHDGSINTLDEVLEFYAKGGVMNQQLDMRITRFYMDERIKRDLRSFLEALNGELPPGAATPPTQLPQ